VKCATEVRWVVKSPLVTDISDGAAGLLVVTQNFGAPLQPSLPHVGRHRAGWIQRKDPLANCSRKASQTIVAMELRNPLALEGAILFI
jgi:hypothetical protein